MKEEEKFQDYQLNLNCAVSDSTVTPVSCKYSPLACLVFTKYGCARAYSGVILYKGSLVNILAIKSFASGKNLLKQSFS